MPTTSSVQLLHNVLGRIHCHFDWQCRQSGPQHQPMWQVTLLIDGIPYAAGLAGRKHAAKEAAAEMMLATLETPCAARAAALWGATSTDPLVP
ncbi:hypothetical protein AURDEDRAFT_168549 [Auricularia subglabra TFB-10046 SS5]|nr:hypothetical protein AURDEDRAFT_168549 [Auricularia subglabra TFB-10046 SS5]